MNTEEIIRQEDLHFFYADDSVILFDPTQKSNISIDSIIETLSSVF